MKDWCKTNRQRVPLKLLFHPPHAIWIDRPDAGGGTEAKFGALNNVIAESLTVLKVLLEAASTGSRRSRKAVLKAKKATAGYSMQVDDALTSNESLKAPWTGENRPFLATKAADAGRFYG